MALKKLKQRLARKKRVRRKVVGTSDRPRLSVFRSNNQIYAQVIDDELGRTLVQASSIDKELAAEIKTIKANPPKPVEEPKAEEGKAGKKASKKKKKKPAPLPTVNKLIAKRIGEVIADRCKDQKIGKVVFDRNGVKYHGRIKSLAEAARKGGLSF